MTIRFLLGFVATALLLAAPAAFSHAGACALTGLAWIAGNWHDASDPQRAQERWVVAPDNILMGSSWEIPKGKVGFAEVMTFRPNGNAISMYLRHFDGALSGAWEERNAPMIFTAANCDASSAIFDGQGDHAGEHLTYKRAGDRLLIIGDFLHHGTPNQMQWHMTRAGD
jgi:Domain of unknown function (DUF6265)